MTNKEKAEEIIKMSNTKEVYDVIDFPSLEAALSEDLMQMAAWKDEQFAKEGYTKEQLIEMGFPFTLNGDIVYPDESVKDLWRHINIIKLLHEQYAAEKAALMDRIFQEFEFQNFTYVDIDGNLDFDYDKFAKFLDKVAGGKINRVVYENN